ncbi:MAG: coenzyme F420-0:L-glutamate ligase [Chloroflexi bacterium]|nr:coenzyme F420-0:L-glutamate ligase [Chloroflexota bacterium]
MSIAPDGLRVFPLHGIPDVMPGDDLSRLIADAVSAGPFDITDSDVLVVAQKVVSKAEGSIVRLEGVNPGTEAIAVAEKVNKDARLVEVILSQSKRIVRSVPGVLITETNHGLICANAGVDASNSLMEGTVVLLPRDPDGSARGIMDGIKKQTGKRIAVIVSDTFNRPWRNGSINVAIGTAGFEPLDDQRGALDDVGHTLRATVVSVADEIASSAQLVMGETGGIPAAVVQGLILTRSNNGSGSLLRDPGRDLFR